MADETGNDATEKEPLKASPDPDPFVVWGVIFLLAGLSLMIWGFAMDASIPVSGYRGVLGDRVNNTGLMNTKLLLVMAGSALTVSGSVFLARKP